METMKFCPVCGVLVSDQQPAQPQVQTNQGFSGAVYTPPNLPSFAKKKPSNLAIGVLVFIAIIAFISTGDENKNSAISSDSNSDTQASSFADVVEAEYLPLNTEISAKFMELSDYAFAEDAESLMSGCKELKALAQKGLTLSPTGIPQFDKAWDDAMASGVTSSEYCIAGDFDTASTYLTQMSAQVEIATSYIN
jgi:hypothetical protein